MKPTQLLTCIFAAALAIALGAGTGRAQFDSGSDGSDGVLDLTEAAGTTTLQVPPDGAFHFTSVTIPFGKTLRFTPNALNTPVYLLATNEVIVEGKIQLNGAFPVGRLGGKGGTGGFDGGAARNGEIPPGAGLGPGAGHPQTDADPAGLAGHATAPGGARDGASYGNPLLLNPLGGSGGGGSETTAAGGGGGAIVIASNAEISLGSGDIEAFGRQRSSGGSVRLVAPEVGFLSNSATVSLDGGAGASPGRLRIDTLNLVGEVRTTGNPSVTVGKFMTVRPPNQPTLAVVEAAGTAVAEGTPSPISLTLPSGSPTSQTVRVRARGFNATVPIRVVITPESGEPSEVETEIDNAADNPAEIDVNVTLPVNIPTRIDVYTQ